MMRIRVIAFGDLHQRNQCFAEQVIIFEMPPVIGHTADDLADQAEVVEHQLVAGRKRIGRIIAMHSPRQLDLLLGRQ